MAAILDWMTGVGGTLLAFLFVLAIVVFFHELGHFQVARWFRTKVDSFSIGFGPEIFGWLDGKGTRWKLCWIPLGGYVKFAGDDNPASVPDKEHLERLRASGADVDALFHFKPVGQRAAIVAAGPIANFILAIVIFALLAMIVGERILLPRVDQVTTESPAAAAGFEPGDVVTAINGRSINSFAELQQRVALNPSTPLDITVRRDGDREVVLTVTPEAVEITDRFGNTQRIGRLGIQRDTSGEEVRIEHHGPISAIGYGTERTWDIITATLGYIGGIFAGTQSADQLGGPVRIAQMSGQVASFGIAPLFTFIAIISVSIGLLNLFPIPMLDGGHLVFYAYEAVAGRPLPERIQELGFQIGLAMLIALMIFATWNDLV
ncbi:MAG: RIP metalloprotease RseP [Alphaproteobacteria bacterium]